MNRRILCGRRGINPVSQQKATAKGWRMVFEHPGLPFIEPVFATLSEDPTAETPGVLYELSPGDTDRLSRSEGHNYKHAEVVVTDAAFNQIDAFTYLSIKREKRKRPSKRYLILILEGARENNLPDEYIQELKRTPTVHIPIVASIVTVVFTILTKLTASGRKINILGFKLGAKGKEWR